MVHLTPADYRRMPWKNGLGVTSEIVRVDGVDGEIEWRVSIAEVAADGPFSRFPGCDRVIVTIAGAGMVLTHPALGRSVTLGPLVPHGFDGDCETFCSLPGGAVRDFNLISRRGRVTGSVAVVRVAPGESSALPLRTVLLHCLAGDCLGASASSRLQLAPGETALAEGRDEEILAAVAGGEPVLAIAVAVARVDPGRAARE